MSQIIVVPSGEMTAKGLEKLEAAGYVVVVSGNPDKIKVLSPEINTNDYFMAALEAIANSVTGHERFVKELNRRLKEKEDKIKKQQP